MEVRLPVLINAAHACLQRSSPFAPPAPFEVNVADEVARFPR